jgi:hypothetical protein
VQGWFWVGLVVAQAAQRPVGTLRVLYYNCLHLDVFAAEPSCRIRSIPMPSRFHRAALIEF